MGYSIKFISDFHPKYGYRMVKKLLNLFGAPFIFLAGSIFFTQIGILGDLVTNVQFPYYREAGIDYAGRAEMNIIATAPDNLKSFIGLVTDLFPIGGRKKFYYIFFYLIVGIICIILLGTLPLHVANNEPIIAAVLFFGLKLSTGASDVLFEAKNIELMQRNIQIKSDLLSFCWFLDCIGQLFPNILTGIISEYYDVRDVFIILLPFILIPIPLLLIGGLIEDESENSISGLNTSKLISEWKIVIVSSTQFLISIVSILVTYFFNETIQLIYGSVTGIIMIIFAFILLDFRIAKWFTFLVLNASFYVEIQAALEYYYRDTECAENGPQFNYVMINTFGPVINNLIQFFAIFCFQVLFSSWKFSSVLLLILSIRVGCTFFDLMIITGWTRAIGIPDELTYLFGFATVGMMAFRIMIYVFSYLNAKLCPKNFEATMYSIFSSAGYVGVTIARFIGLYLMDSFGIVSDYKPEEGIICNYDNLWLVTLIGHCLLPLLTIILIYILVPNIRMNQQFEEKPLSLNKSQLKVIKNEN